MITKRTNMIILAAMAAFFAQFPIATSEAAVSGARSSPTDVDAASSRLLAAAEPFEALTETAFSAQGLQLNSAIAAADRAAQGSRDLLPTASKAQLEMRLTEIHVARKSDDRAGIAIPSVEAYRILVSAARPGKVPTAVNLMDYAGFRYDADFRAKPIRWSDMKAAASFGRQQWTSIAGHVADSALKQNVEAA